MGDAALQELFNTAIEMEIKGRNFYNEAAGNSRNEITKKTFRFLAGNETLHIEAIKKFYESMKEKGELPELNLDARKPERQKELGIFAKDIKELKDKVKKSDTDIKACEFAMDFENNGYRFYKGMLEKASDDRLRNLLQFLLDEEKRHYDGLTDLHSYLTDSANWYMYDEHSFPQG